MKQVLSGLLIDFEEDKVVGNLSHKSSVIEDTGIQKENVGFVKSRKSE